MMAGHHHRNSINYFSAILSFITVK